MLLSTARNWPGGAGWALEPKWDGYRLVAHVEGGSARCWSRHGTDLTSRVGPLAEELVELLPDRSIIDGEILALTPGPQGEPGQDFDRLSPERSSGAAMIACGSSSSTRTRLGGEQLAGRPWHERRSALEGDVAHGCRHERSAQSMSSMPIPTVHARLLTLGFEGSVLKRRDGRYLQAHRVARGLAQAQEASSSSPAVS